MPRNRKPNFSVAEVESLLHNVGLDQVIIFSALSNDITNRQKNAVWEGIALKLSSLGVAPRTSAEARDKWGKLKAEAIGRREARRRTGSKEVKVVPWDRTVFDIIGDRSLLVEPIDVEGTETFLHSWYNKSKNKNTGVSKAVVSGVPQSVLGAPSLNPGVPSNSNDHVLVVDQPRGSVIPYSTNGHILVVDNDPARINVNDMNGHSTGVEEAGPPRNDIQPDEGPLMSSTMNNEPKGKKRRGGGPGSLFEQYLRSQIQANLSSIKADTALVQTNKAKRRRISLLNRQTVMEMKRMNRKNSLL